MLLGNNIMRTSNVIKNVTVEIAGQVFTLLLSFVSRTLFLMILGAKYLGVSSLFTNILTLLSFAELGVGTAIIYSLYKPLAQKNDLEILAHMNLYKKIYRVVGCVVLAAGIALLPCLDFFLPDRKGIEHLEYIYLLFVINTATSYFFTFNLALITADQKAYKLVKINFLFKLLNALLPIVALIIARDYFAYLIVQIICVITQNAVVYLKVRREYPLLRSPQKPKLDSRVKKELAKNVSALFLYKFAMVIVAGTDNILISRFFSIIEVGMYANYFMIANNVTFLISQGMRSITASIGNLAATESDDKKYEIFNVTQFLGFWIYGFTTILFFILFNPFITLWLGPDYLFNLWVVLPICLMFYTLGMQSASTIFRDAQGIFWQGRFRPLAQAIVNLAASIGLTILTGSIAAIFWGTVISRVTTLTWYDPYIVHKLGFHKSAKQYYIRYIVFTAVMFATGAVCFCLGSLMQLNAWIDFFWKCFICLVVPNVIFYALFRNMAEFKYLSVIVKTIIVKVKKRIKQKYGS